MRTSRKVIHSVVLVTGAIILGACGSLTVVPTMQPAVPILPTPSISSTATLAQSISNNIWGWYKDSIYGISFEYPVIYGEKPYQGNCDPVEAMDGVDFGETNEVFVRQQQEESLEQYVQSFIPTYFANHQVKIESQKETEINDRFALVLEYELDNGVAGRKLVFITDPTSKLVFIFSFIGGSACDIPELGLSEEIVFQHAVDTFQVQK